jgi:prepilin-type N-terminal cleavage/methylation domain-containing protein
MNRRTNGRAFTLVEILVVISIIGILISLLAVGIQRAIETSKGTKDQSRARQLLMAWQQYANNNGDQCLPGYLSTAAQASWKVKFQNQNGQQLSAALSQTYGWRLAGYLGYAYDPFLGYRPTAEDNLDESLYYSDMPYEPTLPAQFASITADNGAGLALQPGFGYNAYYVGGWWDVDPTIGIPAFRFRDATFQNGTSTVRGKVVARSIGQIARSSEMMVFSSSALRPAGLYIEDNDDYPGAAWSVPPRLGSTEIWRLGGGNLQGVDLSGLVSSDALSAMLAPTPRPSPAPFLAGGLEVLTQEAAPLLRYGGSATAAHADGSTAVLSLKDLLDMRRWSNAATGPNWSHSD